MTYGDLPICPKCKDTKYVSEQKCIKMLPDLITYTCVKCRITWDVFLKKDYNHEFK